MGIKVLGNLTIGTVNQYIEQQNNYFNVAADEEPTCEVEEVKEDEAPAEEPEMAALVAVLTLVFRGNKEEAELFVRDIRGQEPAYVTRKVNELIRSGKIAKEYRGRTLWKALHENGLYTPTESNWNYHIK